MELINPNVLWGLAAIAAPILIHFWNQKQAKNVDWAAMKWLVESQKLKAKGFRFDDWLLLILRILAIALLVLIIAKPLLDKLGENNETPLGKIHVVAKDKATAENFKFEINEALTKKEPVFWIDNLNKNIEKLEANFVEKETYISDIQNIANNKKIDFSKKRLHLYLPNDINLGENPNLFLPRNFEVFFSNKTPKEEGKALSTNGYIYIDADKKLTNNSTKPSKKIIEKKEIKVAINITNQTENNNAKAAFEAIKEVYGFPFIYVNQSPEIVIGDQIEKYKNAELIILLKGSQNTAKNVVFLNENLNAGSAFRAELPEQILEILLNHYQLLSQKSPLSKQQLRQIFKEHKSEKTKDKILIDKYLCLLLLGIVITERWISLKKNK